MKSTIYSDTSTATFKLTLNGEWENYVLLMQNELNKETSTFYITQNETEKNHFQLNTSKNEMISREQFFLIDKKTNEKVEFAAKKYYFDKLIVYKKDSFVAIWYDFLDLFLNKKNNNDCMQILNMFTRENKVSTNKTFCLVKQFSFEQLKKEVNRCPLLPNENEVDFAYMMHCLKKIFLRYQEKGTVELIYHLVTD